MNSMRVLATTVALAFTSTSTFAICYGSACEGKDPAVEQCGPGAAYGTKGIYDRNGMKIATLGVKWSSKCATNWGIINNLIGLTQKNKINLIL